MARKFGINPGSVPKVESPLLKRFNENPGDTKLPSPKPQDLATARAEIDQIEARPVAPRKSKTSQKPARPTGNRQVQVKAGSSDRTKPTKSVKFIRPTVPSGIPSDQRQVVERLAKVSGQELSNIVLAVTKRATASIAANEEIDIALFKDAPEMAFGGPNRRLSIPEPLFAAAQRTHDPLQLHTAIHLGKVIYAAYARREIAALADQLSVSK